MVDDHHHWPIPIQQLIKCKRHRVHPLLSSDPHLYSAGRGISDTPVVPDYKALVAEIIVK